MARRVRTTVTVREDDPVPRRRRKNSNTVLIVVLLVLLGLFILNRTHQGNVLRPQPASVRH